MATPLVDMQMMRLPAVWTTNLVALLVGAGMYAFFGFVPQYVQTPSTAGYGFGASIAESGLILLPFSVTMFAVGLVSGRLAARVGSKAVVIGGTATATAVVPFVLLVVAHDHKWSLYTATAIMGAGFGPAFAAMASLIVDAVPAEHTGVASGMNADIRTIGGSIGAAPMTSIVNAGGRRLAAGGGLHPRLRRACRRHRACCARCLGHRGHPSRRSIIRERTVSPRGECSSLSISGREVGTRPAVDSGSLA
ncbi:MFS transporter [Rhodococcus oxybenzonivorans]|uniref:MFS transporter n=1 Tax=Rhodococcus oxybenzonivorans TaxID=1990687 RepID=UPI001E40F281|nr:MFS transporter [Rhodococcus oxybenzonivorans]